MANKQKVAHDLDSAGAKPKTVDIMIDENLDFDGMLLSEPILKGLKRSGFKRPSPIQLKAIPPARCGVDLIVQAKSGTGKTCVFVVVALETIVATNSATQVLVLSPTREIARQSYETFVAVGSCISGLKCGCFIGGPTLKMDRVTSKQCHVAVGTPGRICQLIQEGDLSVDSVRLFVLDEADKLMDESYQENVNWVFSRLPANKQLMVLSATYPRQLDEFLSQYMKTPQMIKLDSDDVQLVGIKQYVFTVPSTPGEDWWEQKVEGLHELLSKATFSQCLIFCNYQDKVERLFEKLKEKDWPVEFIAAQLTQPQRLTVMRRLKKFQCRILVSTDLTARGIDAEHVNLVINFDIPFNAETYFHRIGRAGRFGGYGAAITMLCGWQTEYSFYQMAIENNFRAKQLPNDFPMDVVANEKYFENLPALKLPDMEYLERKLAYKNARKSVNLQSEDFYGKLLKTYGYRFKRNDPDEYKFVPTIFVNSENTVPDRYNRDVFETVLNGLLGLKMESTKKSVDKKSKSKNWKKSATADCQPPDRESKIPQIVGSLFNGNIVDKSENVESSEKDCQLPDRESQIPQIVGNLFNGNIVDKSENVESSEKDCQLPDRESQIPQIVGSLFNGNIVESSEKDCQLPDRESKIPQIVGSLFNGNIVESSEKDCQLPDPESQIPQIVGNLFNGNIVDKSQNVESSEKDCQLPDGESQIPQIVRSLFNGNIVDKSQNVESSEKPKKVPYFEFFEKTLDSHLGYLYGGLSWHAERAKFLTAHDAKNSPESLGLKDESVLSAELSTNAAVTKRVGVHDLLSAAVAKSGTTAAENGDTSSIPVVNEMLNLAKTGDLPYASDPGKNFIKYSRDALLYIWNDVAVNQRKSRDEPWYDSLIKLGLFVDRYFVNVRQQQHSLECNGGNGDVADHGNFSSDEDHACPCWSQYEKVLENYDRYIKNYTSNYGSQGVAAYENSVQNLRGAVNRRRNIPSAGENFLANCQREMSAYCENMLTE